MKDLDLMFEEAIASLSEEVTAEPCVGGDSEMRARINNSVGFYAHEFVTKLQEKAGDKYLAAAARYGGSIEPIVTAASRKTTKEGLVAWIALGIANVLTQTLSKPELVESLISVSNLPSDK